MSTPAALAIFQVRDYRPADLAQLAQIDRICFPPGIAATQRDLEATVMSSGASTIVAEAASGEVAGFAIAAKSSRCGHVVTLDISPPFRRQGLATRLMEAVELRFLQQGVAKITLEVAVGNEAAEQLYEKLGFRRGRQLDDYYAKGSAACLMEKCVGVRRRT